MPAPHDHVPTAFVQRLASQLANDPRVEALWLEADDDRIQWPPYALLDLHFGVPENELESVRRDLGDLLMHAGTVSDFSQQEAPLKGFAGSARLPDGTALTYRIERMSQVGKVPRRSVNVLIDRTGGLLIPTLSFE